MKNCLLLLFFSIIVFQGYGKGIIEKIDITETVNIAGSNQILRIKGDDIQNPVLLYLNGGPGDSVTDHINKLFGKLQKNFVVVLWDQRKSGKTLHLDNEEVVLSQELLKNDTHILIEYLLQRFNKEKIVLVGHSYGTTLGFDIAKNYPELVHYFVATNPMVNQVESEQKALEILMDKAKADKNKEAIEDLSQVDIPFENSEDLYFSRKWLFDYDGRKFAKKAPFKSRVFSWSSLWLNVFNESVQENLFESTKQIGCPILFIIGEKDIQTNSTITEEYFKLLEAPSKEIQVVKGAGHLIPFKNNKVFQNTILEYTLPSLELK